MEADPGAQLVTNSSILKACNLRVKVVVGDGDASTMAAIRRYAKHRIFKIADRNHLNKNFSGDVFNSKQLRFKELSKDAISHTWTCFSYAVVQNRGQSDGLREALPAIPDHLFERHDNCKSWCKALEKGSQTVLLTNGTLYNSLNTAFARYAENAEKFCIAG